MRQGTRWSGNWSGAVNWSAGKAPNGPNDEAMELDGGTLVTSSLAVEPGGQVTGNGTVVGNLVIGSDPWLWENRKTNV